MTRRLLTPLLILAIVGSALAAEFPYSFAVSAILKKQPGPLAVPLTQSLPDYPMDMRRQGLVGAATVRLSITGDGLVREVAVLKKSEQVFADAVVACAKKWTFIPAQRRGAAVESSLEYLVLFEIKDEE